MVSLMQLKLRMAQTLDVAEVAGSSVKHFAEVDVFMVPLMQLRPRLMMLVGCLHVWQGGLQGLAMFADVLDVLMSHIALMRKGWALVCGWGEGKEEGGRQKETGGDVYIYREREKKLHTRREQRERERQT